MNNLDKLLSLVRPPMKTPPQVISRPIKEAGFLWGQDGTLIGPDLELDNYQHGGCHPLWVYNRSQRFQFLLSPSGIDRKDHEAILRTFESLETAWKSTKRDYLPRKYFLSQRVCLDLICSKLRIRKPARSKPPIRDKKRLHQQLIIFNKLWGMIQPEMGALTRFLE